MFAVICTRKQTGSVLGTVAAIVETEPEAWARAKKLRHAAGQGVVRLIAKGTVDVGETVGYLDARMADAIRADLIDAPKRAGFGSRRMARGR